MADGEAFFGKGAVFDNAVKQCRLVKGGEQNSRTSFAVSHGNGSVVVVNIIYFPAVVCDILPAEFVCPGNQSCVVIFRSKPCHGRAELPDEIGRIGLKQNTVNRLKNDGGVVDIDNLCESIPVSALFGSRRPLP